MTEWVLEFAAEVNTASILVGSLAVLILWRVMQIRRTIHRLREMKARVVEKALLPDSDGMPIEVDNPEPGDWLLATHASWPRRLWLIVSLVPRYLLKGEIRL